MGNIIDLTNKYNNIEERQHEWDIKHKKQKEHRTKQIIGRCSLAGLAAVGIITSTSFHGPKIVNYFNKTDIENEFLDKTTVLDDAELTLLEAIYGKNSKYINEAIINYHIIDEIEDINSITVTNNNKEIFKHIHSGLFIKDQNNPPEVNSFLDKMIDIHFDKNPSQKKLQDLNTLIEILNDMDLNFESTSKTIINNNEKDNER